MSENATSGTETYSHPDHAEMEWYEADTDRVDVEGWRCTRCHVIAPPDEADDVFEEHDCDHYKNLQEGITGSL